MDVVDMNEYYKYNIRGQDHVTALENLTGLNCTRIYNNFTAGVIDQLQRGYPVMVAIRHNNGRFRCGTAGHLMTVLAISEDGQQVYICDPGSRSAERNGWFPISVLDDNPFSSYFRLE